MDEMEKFEGWGQDPEKARMYLYERCKLEKGKKFGFYFEDGTGFCGTVEEFIPYLMRRFKWNPDDSFEIDQEYDNGNNPPSGELYEPSVDGEVWSPAKKDSRF